MGYEETKEAKTLESILKNTMEKSERTYKCKGNLKTYYELSIDGDDIYYFEKELSSIMKWLNAIFRRFENAKDIPKNVCCPIPDDEYLAVKRKITGELNMVIRMHIFITDCFFVGENREYLDDYLKTKELFVKISTNYDMTLEERRACIRKLYAYLWEKESDKRAELELKLYQANNPKKYTSDELERLRRRFKKKKKRELDDYFPYQKSLDVLSEDFPELDIKNPEYRYIEIKKSYRELKAYFSKIVIVYMTVINGVIAYDDKLTEDEIDLIKLLYELNDKKYKDALSNASKNKWEFIDENIRNQIIVCIDKIHKNGGKAIYKYTGATTAAENKWMLEWTKFKLRRPISYRIFSKIDDIKANMDFSKALEEDVVENADSDKAKKLKKIEKDLAGIYDALTEINDTQKIFNEYIDKVYCAKLLKDDK